MEDEHIGIGRVTSWVVGSGLAVVGLSILQTVQDFSQSIPAKLGLGMFQAAIILAIVYWFQLMIVMFAAAEQRTGYIGGAILGALWLLVSLMAFPSQPAARVLAVGVMLATIALLVSSALALRAVEQYRESERAVA